MSPAFDQMWLMNAASFVNQSLLSAIYAAGLVLALRRWRGGGRSARFAAFGFGIGLANDLAGVVVIVGYEWLAETTVFTPYTEPNLWPMLIFTAGLSLLSLSSTILILLALWTAWRDRERNDGLISA